VSHCSIQFVLYAARHDIVVLCLPPHTTHRLQPCDVGIFAHVAHEWANAARIAFKDGVKITKFDFLKWYTLARTNAIKPERIVEAFETCGIFPLNPNVISRKDIQPAEQTTICAAQPLPAILPTILEPIPDHTPETPDHTPLVTASTISLQYRLKGLPSHPGPNATREVLHDQLALLYDLLAECVSQMSYDHAQKIIMEEENEIYRRKLYGKKKDKGQVTHLNVGARVLTSEEAIDALYEADRKKLMGVVFKEVGPIMKAIRTWIEEGEKDLIRADEQEEENAIKAHKAEEKNLSNLAKELEAAKATLARYDKLRVSGKAAKTQANNELNHQEQSIKVNSIKEKVTYQIQLTAEAEAKMKPLVQRRKDRIEAIAQAEKDYQDALAKEREEAGEVDILEAQRLLARRSSQRRVLDSRSHWQEKLSSWNPISKFTKNDQENVKRTTQNQPSVMVRPPVDIAELDDDAPDIPIDPVLQLIDLNRGLGYSEMADMPL
jgi:hypothetical protein